MDNIKSYLKPIIIVIVSIVIFNTLIHPLLADFGMLNILSSDQQGRNSSILSQLALYLTIIVTAVALSIGWILYDLKKTSSDENIPFYKAIYVVFVMVFDPIIPDRVWEWFTD